MVIADMAMEVINIPGRWTKVAKKLIHINLRTVQKY